MKRTAKRMTTVFLFLLGATLAAGKPFEPVIEFNSEQQLLYNADILKDTLKLEGSITSNSIRTLLKRTLQQASFVDAYFGYGQNNSYLLTKRGDKCTIVSQNNYNSEEIACNEPLQNSHTRFFYVNAGYTDLSGVVDLPLGVDGHIVKCNTQKIFIEADGQLPALASVRETITVKCSDKLFTIGCRIGGGAGAGYLNYIGIGTSGRPLTDDSLCDLKHYGSPEGGS